MIQLLNFISTIGKDGEGSEGNETCQEIGKTLIQSKRTMKKRERTELIPG